MDQVTPLSVTTLLVSLLAVFISAIALYRASFHRGRLRMTQPTPILLSRDSRGLPKVSMMTMLFTTGNQGNIIESMYTVIRRGSTVLALPQWSYSGGNKPGSAGLHVPSAGISLQHEFVGAPDSSDFQFAPGDYLVETFASPLTTKRGPVRLDRAALTIPAGVNVHNATGVMFTWLPSEKRYSPESISPTQGIG